jgi:hypothetical protein
LTLQRIAIALGVGLNLLACAGPLTYRPGRPVQASAAAFTAEIRDILIRPDGAKIDLLVKAPAGAVLIDAHVTDLPAAPCSTSGSGATSVSRVEVDQQEDYHAGPADLSGTAHEVTLRFEAPAPLWKSERLAIDLELAPAIPFDFAPTFAPKPATPPSCLRLELSGITGADWTGSD